MFILKNIHLENFMTIETLDMEFEETCTIAITGQNGAGKSSLLYAIALCLTGYRQGESYRDYVRIGEETASIQLEAFFRDKPIFYEMEISGGEKKSSTPLKKRVVYEGVEYLNSDYSQFLEKYELEDLESLMFMFQDSDDIVKTRPAERAATLKKLFRFEFNDIVDKLKEEQEQFKTEEIEYTAVINELKSKTFERQRLLREKLPSVIDSWKERLSEITSSLDQLADVDDNSLNICEQKLQDTQVKINTEISKIDRSKTTIKTTEENLNILLKYLEESSEEELQEEIDTAKEELEKHQEEYEEEKKVFNEKSSELKVLKYRLSELEDQIKVSETGVCHACGQPITKEHINTLLIAKDSLSQNIENLNKEINNLNFDIRDVASSTLRKEISEKESNFRKYKEALRNKALYEKQLKDTKEVLSYAETYLESLYETQGKLEEEQKKLSDIRPLLRQRNDLEQERSTLEQEITSANDLAISNQEKRKINEYLEKEEKERDQKLEEYSEKLNEVGLSISSGKTLIDIFGNKFPTFITLQACIRLENYVNEIIQKVFPTCKVSLRLNRGGVNFFYTPDESTDKWISVAMASGAQKDILNLAYRLSLARMYNITCLCLDEIDAACSDENADIIYNFIVNLDCFNQILFISHRQESIKAVKSLNSDALVYYVENGEYELVS